MQKLLFFNHRYLPYIFHAYLFIINLCAYHAHAHRSLNALFKKKKSNAKGNFCAFEVNTHTISQRKNKIESKFNNNKKALRKKVLWPKVTATAAAAAAVAAATFKALLYIWKILYFLAATRTSIFVLKFSFSNNKIWQQEYYSGKICF